MKITEKKHMKMKITDTEKENQTQYYLALQQKWIKFKHKKLYVKKNQFQCLHLAVV